MRKKVFIIAVFVCAFLAYGTFARSGVDQSAKDEWYKQVELFSDALALVHSGYVDEVKPKDMIYGALKGMLASLDPHSQFLDPDSYAELKTDTEGKFGGVGIEITIKDGLLTVITPIEDTPAWKAGVKAQDRIVRIDDQITRDMTLTDAVKKMRGKPGEPVTITVLRESERKLLEFKLVRDIIMIADIKETQILQDGIGYIRLVEFREQTPQDIDAALKKLSQEKMTGLILDLRNNPGGLLESAVKVAAEFVETGKIIVYTRGRQKNQNLELISKNSKPILDLPLVVLINEGSASGSEIVAGCLKDYKRAIIVGEKSFGKGSVQTVIPLNDGSALRLTTSKYFTPLGNVIHEKGVIPDIEVAELPPQIAKAAGADENKTEEIFAEVEKQGAGAQKDETIEKPKEQTRVFDYKADNQIMRAIDALRIAQFYKVRDGK